MPESEADSQETGSTVETQGTASTGIPLARLPARPVRKNEHDLILPTLPSHKFQYSVWHDLKHVHLKGNELHAPRVRNGPPVKERMFDGTTEQEDEGPIHHSLKGQDQIRHRGEHENWVQAKTLNLSYQELDHEYQRQNYKRILQSAHNVESLILVHNNMVTMWKLSFPRCISLDVNNNYIKSFAGLAETPNIRYLSAAYNNIKDFSHLDRYRSTPLEELNLIGNPVAFLVNYRQTVFETLPNLKVLDNIAKTAADSVWSDTDDLEEAGQAGCVIL